MFIFLWPPLGPVRVVGPARPPCQLLAQHAFELDVARLRAEGLTQAQIGERIGWSRSQVNNYLMLIDRVDTAVLDLARSHQNGRVSPDDTVVSFTFTEGWFRDSGLYDLPAEYQLRLLAMR